jgi:arylsulfatase A-like enzyme
VPFVIRWKGHLPEGKIDSRPIIQLDVLPTALAAAAVTIKPEWKLDGVNLLLFIRGTADGMPHEALYWRLFRHMAIRKGDWKLVRTMDGPLIVADPPTRADLADAQLFNLSEDIGERDNVASKHPGKVRELLDDWLRWNAELAKPLWRPGGA